MVSHVFTKGANKGKLYWRIEWEPGFGPRFTQGFTSAQAIFAQEVAKQMDRYVPFRTGTLKNSVHLASDYERGVLIYNTPYARKQYTFTPRARGSTTAAAAPTGASGATPTSTRILSGSPNGPSRRS